MNDLQVTRREKIPSIAASRLRFLYEEGLRFQREFEAARQEASQWANVKEGELFTVSDDFSEIWTLKKNEEKADPAAVELEIVAPDQPSGDC